MELFRYHYGNRHRWWPCVLIDRKAVDYHKNYGVSPVHRRPGAFDIYDKKDSFVDPRQKGVDCTNTGKRNSKSAILFFF